MCIRDRFKTGHAVKESLEERSCQSLAKASSLVRNVKLKIKRKGKEEICLLQQPQPSFSTPELLSAGHQKQITFPWYQLKSLKVAEGFSTLKGREKKRFDLV